MRNSVFVALSALTLASAQTSNFTINPNNVPLTTRANWCTAQGNTCNILCSNNPSANSCDPNTLDFSCLCSNNSAPGLQYYDQTMPTFICNEAFSECNAANVNNAQAQANCTTSIKDECGTLNPANFTAPAASSSSGGATATAKTTGSTTSAGSSPTTTSSKAGAAPTAMAHIGSGAAAVALGVFAYLL